MQQACSGTLIKMDGVIMENMDMSCLIATVGCYTYTTGIQFLDAITEWKRYSIRYFLVYCKLQVFYKALSGEL